MPNYRKPPIIEAVVEVRFGSTVDDRQLNRFEARLRDRYPTPPQKVANLSVETSGAGIRINQEQAGFRILSADGAFTVTAGRNLVATSRAAPYPGWECFLAEVRANWDDWSRIVGWMDIIRIGLRYVNRIDIPLSADREVMQMSDYLTFFVNAPIIAGFGPMNGYAATTEIPTLDGSVKLVLNTGPAVSPLLNTGSFVLDLDVGMDNNLPQSEEALWTVLEHLRFVKNSAFEASITSQARALFL